MVIFNSYVSHYQRLAGKSVMEKNAGKIHDFFGYFWWNKSLEKSMIWDTGVQLG
jgi:hypothetical protein